MRPEKLILDDKYSEQPEAKANAKIRFDGTINTGHIFTIVAIIMCSIGAWYDVKTTVASQKVSIEHDETQIEKDNKESMERDAAIQLLIASNQKDNHQEIAGLRTEMNQWFMRLDEKLDKKADKKGM